MSDSVSEWVIQKYVLHAYRVPSSTQSSDLVIVNIEVTEASNQFLQYYFQTHLNTIFRPFLSVPGKTEFLLASYKKFKMNIIFQLSYPFYILLGIVAVWKLGLFFLRRQQGTSRSFNKHLPGFSQGV